ncbi:ribbon-helix-helix protein, CopG family [Chromobacterium haemolyticum]|uniref:Ribbon-helix-helix protein, CopG family n=1 Tax=Chromobacterium fluminis TaxID=3044269 RepID=A0ABX0KYR0_9NEIS|nr:CopG family ribbon-helix-helix protein [Chromobacterium haemolyticum]NHR04654.1 ribbon-helix-helix protein, CopG family [Chromobacterium haemolyticum]
MSVMSVRVADDVAQQLEALAHATGRSKSFLVAQAIGDYLEREAWQVQAIEAGLKEADAGNFASSDEVSAFFAKHGA